MSCAPGIIFARRSKKNPYADRGLAEFALLSAELEAKRKKLLVQLGAPLSFVRFANCGSDQTKWIPIIICPTLSTEEIRTLRHAATNLISEDRSEALIVNGKPTQTGNSSGNAKRGGFRKSATSAQNHPSDVKTGEDAHNNRSLAAYIAAAAERFLWMAAFGLNIVADIIRNALGLKARPDIPPKRRPVSSRQEVVNKHNPSATMASSVHTPPTTMLGMQHIKTKGPPNPLHVKVAKAHIKWENTGCSTAPSTPTNSRQPKKPFLASTASLPKTCTLEDQGTVKEKQLCVIPRTTTCLQESDPQRGSNSTVNKAGRKEKAEKLGQALRGAGVVLGLGGLVMGYLPAIVSIVCWWYLLPTLRKAVGDKPIIVKSQHHQKRS